MLKMNMMIAGITKHLYTPEIIRALDAYFKFSERAESLKNGTREKLELHFAMKASSCS